MPALPIDLRNRKVVVTVFVLLAVVAAINVRTFRPVADRLGLATSMPDEPMPAPDDLPELARCAASRIVASAVVPATCPLIEPTATAGRPVAVRDPFVAGSNPRPAVAGTPNAPTSAAPMAPVHRAEPTCTAVLMTPGAPVAFIDGRGYRIGDSVGGATVVEITLAGARLGDRWLPIERTAAPAANFPLVTSSKGH